MNPTLPAHRPRRRPATLAAILVLALAALIAPSPGAAHPASGPTLARTGAPSGGPVRDRSAYRGAPPAANVPGQLTPAGTGPPPPPNKPLCQFQWCQRLIEKLCHRIDCAKLARAFRGTAQGIARRVLRTEKDPAFEKPWDGKGFDAHHIVAQNDRIFGGVARFAQALLRRVGIAADDPDNLAALRNTEREIGKPGYDQLPKSLQDRMAHADTTYRYYYERVNERFAQWIRSHGGRLPNEAEVRAILRSIKSELYAGGRRYVKPGVTPRARDL